MKQNYMQYWSKLTLVLLIATSCNYANAEVNPKVEFTKKQVDNTLSKIEKYANEGNKKKFPSTCATLDSSLVKYTFPDAPKEVYDYYEHATEVCRGKYHTIALHNTLKKEGKSVCVSMEVTLQINHLKSHLKKTDDIAIWDAFMIDYKQTCPNNLNF